MKKKLRVVLGTLLLLPFINLYAQDEAIPTAYIKPDLTGFYLGGQASTNGYGFNLRYAFNHWFSLKTGYETLSFDTDIRFEENDIDYDATLNYRTGGVLLLGDFSYTRNLYISAGVVFNSFHPKMDGEAVSDLQYGDISIPAEDVGTFHFEVEPGIKASPYIGAGYNGYIGKADRVVFNFETGIYYMGKPDFKLEATGLLSPTADPALGQSEYLASQFDAYQIYPVIKLNLAVRLF